MHHLPERGFIRSIGGVNRQPKATTIAILRAREVTFFDSEFPICYVQSVI